MEDKRSWHHRKMRCHGGTKQPRNMSNLSTKEHRAWHTIVGSRQPEDIAALLNARYVDPDYQFVCIRTETRLAHDYW